LAIAANFCSAVGLELHTRLYRAASEPTSQGAGGQGGNEHTRAMRGGWCYAKSGWVSTWVGPSTSDLPGTHTAFLPSWQAVSDGDAV
jgi:hypothetical protein